MIDSSVLHPELADALYASNAGQSWCSPQEIKETKPGDFEHGEVDDCFDGSEHFQRVWYDPAGLWLNVSFQI